MTFQNQEMKKRDLQIGFSHSNDAITVDVLERGWRAPKAKWLSPTVTNERPTPHTNPRRRRARSVLAACCPDNPPTEHLTMVHPTVAQLIDKIDVTIAKYPSITQYGTFPRNRSEGERRGRRRANSVIAVVVAAEWNLIRGRRTNSTLKCTALRSTPIDGVDGCCGMS
jgi:hypothetical protein